jgi:hypothetical protein
MTSSPAAAARAARRKPPVRLQLRGGGEAELETFVVRMAHLYGWCGFHVSFSKGSVTGVYTCSARATTTTTRTAGLIGCSFASE